MIKVSIAILIFCAFILNAQEANFLSGDPSPAIEQKSQYYFNLLDSLNTSTASNQEILKAQVTAVLFYVRHDELKSLRDSLLQAIFSNSKLANDPKVLSKAITARGISEYKDGHFTKAIQSHYEAIKIREKHNILAISYNYHLIAQNLMARGNFEEALKNYLKAIDLGANEKRPNPKLTQRLAYAYQCLEDFENAEKYFLISISEAQQINSPIIEGTSISRLANIYSGRGEYLRAIEMLEESQIKRGDGMHIGHKIMLSNGLAENHLGLGNTKIARIEANRALKIARQINSFGYEQKVLRTLVNIDNKENEIDSSIIHYELLLSARDSFYNLEKTTQFNQLYTQLELGEKEREILQKEVEIEQEGKTRNILYMVIGFLCILGVMGGIMIRNKIKHEKKITQQNKTIKSALEEKEFLLKEIHHRVKNNLQIVSSLLGMQSLSIQDESVKIAIDEGRARVHSMSLIHQNLYQKENLSGIEMKPYISQLSSDLLTTYHYQDKEITLKNNVPEELWLDVETVVPLGLIINELITNSLKHGFIGQSKGTLSIDLRIENGLLILKVKDDGIGIQKDVDKNATFGHSLINAFKSKLDADLMIDHSKGTAVVLKIKSFNTV